MRARLELVAQSGFHRISYTDAIGILEKAVQDFKPGDSGGFSSRGRKAKADTLFEFEVGLVYRSNSDCVCKSVQKA